MDEKKQVPAFEKEIDDLLLRRYVPASVVVTKEFDILQFRGDTSLFLEQPIGNASNKLLDMASENLGVELRKMISKAFKTRQVVRKEHVELKSRRLIVFADIEVVPLDTENADKICLVVFREHHGQVMPSHSKSKRMEPEENELPLSGENIGTIKSGCETIYEELQRAHEEIVSGNKELKLSKEEIESTNEELLAINREIIMRNAELAEAHEYAKAILETIREAVLVLDADLHIISANKSFLDTFGIKEQETIGLSVYDTGNRQWDIPQLRHLMDDVMSGNEPYAESRVEHEFPFIGRKIMHLVAHRVVHNGNILLIMEDITDLAARESLFRNMANHAPVMIWTTTVHTQFDFYNRMWVEYTGKTQEQLLKMKWLHELLPPDREMFLDTYRRAFDNRDIFSAEIKLRHYSGTHRWVVFNGKPAFDDQQKFTGYVGTALDIHEQKMNNEEMERRVEQRTRELNESNTDLKQFAYLASHELQEPLRKIRTFISMQEKTDHLPDIRLFNEKINNSTGRMSALVKDILTFSKLANKNESPATIHLEEIFESVKFDFELMLLEKNARLTYDDLPHIRGISWQIRQLFSNLLSNSLKFSQKTPHIKVASTRIVAEENDPGPGLEPGQAYYKITFGDNGIGFEQHHEHQIFSIFKRLHSTDEYPGTGIGLALCKKIVENHEGSIRVKSAVGEGTVFTIYFPV